jgi:hypothetical protein
MSRPIRVQLDLDTLPTIIRESVQQCFAVHRVQLAIDGRVLSPEETARYMREMGNNTAGVIALQEVTS